MNPEELGFLLLYVMSTFQMFVYYVFKEKMVYLISVKDDAIVYFCSVMLWFSPRRESLIILE